MPKQVHTIEGAVEPIGPYSTATEANGLVFVSGQVPIDPATNSPALGDVSALTRRVMDNIGIVLEGVGLGYSDIAKTTIFLASMADFPIVNEAYGSYFEKDPPARSTVEVAALPGGHRVEIEVIAAR